MSKKCKWGRDKISSKNKGKEKCQGNPFSSGRYCQLHGCSFCFYYKGEEKEEVKVCSKNPECKKKWEEQKLTKENLAKKEQQNLKDNQSEKNNELVQEIQNVSEDFYEKIKGTLEKITDFKYKFIDREYTVNRFFNSITHHSISDCPTLSREEKEKWKKIYNDYFNCPTYGKSRNSECLPNLYPSEKEFLLDLAKKYNDNIERERERERESKTTDYSGYRNRIRGFFIGEYHWIR